MPMSLENVCDWFNFPKKILLHGNSTKLTNASIGPLTILRRISSRLYRDRSNAMVGLVLFQKLQCAVALDSPYLYFVIGLRKNPLFRKIHRNSFGSCKIQERLDVAHTPYNVPTLDRAHTFRDTVSPLCVLPRREKQTRNWTKRRCGENQSTVE